jgi:preprotein translocase subunit SecD
VRARRTILSADTVSFLAAAVLYYFAAGDVKGFAFALGLSTILDLVVVFLFTHPIVSLLSRSKAFGSARFTGLNAVRTGGVVPDSVGEAPASPARRARPEKVAASAKATSAPVVLLEEDEAEPAIEPDEPVAPAAPEAAAPTTKTQAATPEPEEPERVRSAPEPGTAAERAAARRARMRARKGDEKGQR